ncbi:MULTISPECIES: hypothetical protein [unclassified Yimella]|uniref:hypothetical protein n=1 Tax=unclassified Yimella TaxID=2649892 RepID=UPI00101CC61A|nr:MULTISPECIES: hypothetical protein [unclassified Yimella]MCG8655354.1 hypothetical protein [Yimella sp. NH-Cas1]RYG76189.1 hypothetical protein EU513_13460 [Yimella sp. RIT 621]
MRGTVVIAPSESVAADLPTDLSGQILMRVVSVTQDITPLAVAAAVRGAVAVIATRVDAVYPRQSLWSESARCRARLAAPSALCADRAATHHHAAPDARGSVWAIAHE